MLASLAGMALMLALGLARADRLLDRVSRSQTQLALVTRLEADTNALFLAPAGEQPILAGRIATGIAAYRRTVIAEMPLVGAVAQTAEIARAEQLSTAFRQLRAMSRTPADNAAFRVLARRIVAAEQIEATEAITAMRHLRQTGTVIAIVVPAMLALLGAAALLTMLANLLGPIRILRRGITRLEKGDAVGALEVAGFSDFDELAQAFCGMARQIVTQRTALADANSCLERDVADRTAALAERNDRLAAIDANRRLFFAQVSHELRTPITVIMGEAEVALRDDRADADALRDALRHIVANGEFAQRRLEDLLGVAGAEDGRLTLHREAIDLGDVMRTATARARPYARSSGVTITEHSPTGPVEAAGDASWLQQALLALIDNAVKHASSGCAIRMSLEHDGANAAFSVTDDGPGVSSEDLPLLFDTWHQTAAGRRRGGSGLGLAIARWVTEAHHGSIAAHNHIGGGLTVRISLPLAA